jgi:hypothetical protein
MNQQTPGSSIQVISLAACSRWEAATVAAPQSADETQQLQVTINEWLGSRMAEPCTREVFLQVWRLGATPAGKLYSANVQTWLPVRGLGIWPGRRPPQRMTEEIAMDCAAAGLAGEEPPLPSHPVAHVSGGEAAANHAFRSVLGHGQAVAMWFPSSVHASWYTRSREAFQAGIQDPLYQRERFYLPLFDLELLESGTDEQLDKWTLGASAYLREDPSSETLVLLTRKR